MSEGLEWGWAHMLRSNVMVMLLMIDHVRRGEMAERCRVLMETGRHYGCDWWNSWARGCLHHNSPSIADSEAQWRQRSHSRYEGLQRIYQTGGKRRHGLVQGWHVENA